MTPAAKQATFAAAGLQCIGAFCPVRLHDPATDIRAVATDLLSTFGALGATVMVLAADSGLEGYDGRELLDDRGWATLVENVAVISDLAAERGVTVCLHPHVGTMIETGDEVRRFLDRTAAPICLDAGHLLVGGTDPVALARDVPDRVAHVHLKDVDPDVLDTVRSGQRTYTQGVAAGMYRVLGQGSIDLRGIVESLENAGYRGWYVPEHDRMLGSADDVAGAQADAAASVAFLRGL